MEPVLSLVGVSFSYPNARPTLAEVDLTVWPGEWVCVTGPSGAGKSTLGRVAAGLLSPTKGEVKRRGLVGWLPQDPGEAIVGATVWEDVAFGPANQGLGAAELALRVRESMELANLPVDMSERDPLQLSGGERQRLALAGVLAMRPALIVLDEPTSMLDGKSARHVVDTVRKIVAAGAACLYITHSLTEAAMAQRVCVLAGGRVVKTGCPDAVLPDKGVRKLVGGVPPLLALHRALAAYGVAVTPEEWTVPSYIEALDNWRMQANES